MKRFFFFSKPITDQRIDFVSIQKLFAILDYVVVVVVVVAIVVQFALFFVRRVVALRLLGTSLFLGIVDL